MILRPRNPVILRAGTAVRRAATAVRCPGAPAAPPAGRRGHLAAAVAGVVLALGALATPAAAHDRLTGSTPADGASVEVPPAAVELTFAEPPLALGSQVQVTGPTGEVVGAGDLQITGTVVSQPLASGLPAGEYAVAWRVTSSDGHPISGQLVFTALAGADAPQETADPGPAPTATPSPGPGSDGTTAAPAPTVTPEAVTATSDAAATTEEPAGRAAPWVVGAAIVLLVGGTLWWVSRRRGTSGQG